MKLSQVLGLVGSWVLALGCRPQIGDDCVTAQDCSAQGDRLCDNSQPDGYCTVFGCDPDGCPDGSVCVGFGLELDPACEIVGTDPRWKRFQRTFCLATCEEDADCREGYQCRPPAARDAASIDIESDERASNVCLVASDAPPVEPRPCE